MGCELGWDAEWNPQRTEEPGAREGPGGTRRDTTAICKKGVGIVSQCTHRFCGILVWHSLYTVCVSARAQTHTHCIEIYMQSFATNLFV